MFRGAAAVVEASGTQYDSPVISHRTGNSRQLLVAVGTAVALVAAILGRYAAQTVRPHCVVEVSGLTDGDGRNLPDVNGRVRSDEELTARAYQQSVDSGRRDPPTARWKQWPHPGQLVGFSQTDTCFVLSLVNRSRVHPSHRSRSRIPASWAIRSSSDGHTYRNGIER